MTLIDRLARPLRSALRTPPLAPASRIRPRRLLAAVCIAGACALLAWQLTPDRNGTPVVVAAADVGPGAELSASDLSLVDYPRALVPGKSFTAIDDVVGRRTSAGVSKGSPLTRSAVLDQQALPEGSTDLIMPVRLADDDSAGLLQPGQRVRLFSSLPEGGAEVVVDAVTIARIVEAENGLAPVSGQLVSVILSPEDAGRIAEYAGLPISFAILPQ